MNTGVITAPVLARTVPFLIYVAFLPLTDGLSRIVPGGDVRWLYGLQVALVSVSLFVYRRHYTELWEVKAPGLGALAAAIGIGTLVFLLWINLALPYLSFAVGKGFDPRDLGGRVIVPMAAMRVAGAALVVPLMEELFWRSFLMRWIDRQDFLAVSPVALSMRALMLSSLLFGLEHGLWFAGILAGLAYGELYRRSSNLWMPIISHAVTNALLGCWVLYSASWSFW